MNNFVEHLLPFLDDQGDADAIVQIPLDTTEGPLSLESVNISLTDVSGSPTAVTLDLNVTDGSASKVPISGQSLGTSADQLRLVPTDADKAAGTHIVPEEPAGSSAYWYYTIDLNFTAGSTPTIDAYIVVRWAR
jgi:hypothetical protein